MWTIKYQRNNEDYQFNYIAPGEFNTDSPALEALLLSKLQNPPVLYGTPTGPSALFDPDVDYLTYYMIATILFTELGVESWNSEGDYLWPLENTPTKAVFSYLDFLKEKRHEFYNQCHTESGAAGGQFCSDNVEFVGVDRVTQKKLKLVLHNISKVHSLSSSFPKAYVEFGDMSEGTDGYYDAETNQVVLSDKSAGTEITFVHEYGHHVSLGEEGNFSLNQFQDKIDRTPTLSKWRDAVNASDTIQGLRARNSKSPNGFDEYLLDDREMFARTYAQWIATKSGNSILLGQLKENRTHNPNFAWQDNEFAPISKALDDHFNHSLTAAGAGNPCHDPSTGKFCQTPGAPGHEDHRGAPSDDKEWQAALDHKDSLNATQKAAIKWYGWAGSEYVNNHLRGTETPTKNNPQKNEKTIQIIDKAIESAPDLNGKTLYRGIHGGSKFATEQLANAKVGDIYADDGYTSTTTDIKHSRFFTNRSERVSIKPILVIKTKQNTKGLAVNEKEQEIILKRGTGLRVTGPSTKTDDGYTLIPVEVIT